MLRVLLLAFVFSKAAAKNSVNEAVDKVIVDLNKAILQAGLDRISIGDVFYHWKYHIIPGTTKCYRGWVGTLDSLRRVNDVKIETLEKGKRLSISLSLGSLKFGYDNCDIKAVHLISWKGHVEASVDTNLLQALVTIRREGGSCTTALDAIHFTNVGKIKVTTGGKIAHRLEMRVSEQIAGQMNKDIVRRINEKFQVIGSLVLANSNLCDVEV